MAETWTRTGVPVHCCKQAGAGSQQHALWATLPQVLQGGEPGRGFLLTNADYTPVEPHQWVRAHELLALGGFADAANWESNITVGKTGSTRGATVEAFLSEFDDETGFREASSHWQSPQHASFRQALPATIINMQRPSMLRNGPAAITRIGQMAMAQQAIRSHTMRGPSSPHPVEPRLEAAKGNAIAPTLHLGHVDLGPPQPSSVTVQLDVSPDIAAAPPAKRLKLTPQMDDTPPQHCSSAPEQPQVMESLSDEVTCQVTSIAQGALSSPKASQCDDLSAIPALPPLQYDAKERGRPVLCNEPDVHAAIMSVLRALGQSNARVQLARKFKATYADRGRGLQALAVHYSILQSSMQSRSARVVLDVFRDEFGLDV